MRKFIALIACLLFLSGIAKAQETNHLSISAMSPADNYENVLVKKLKADEHTSSFMIWIKKEVKPHKHAAHTEQVYVLEGEALMKLNDRTFTVAAGDYVFIPKGAVHAVKVTSDGPLKVLSVQAPRFEGKDRIWVDEIF